MRIGTLLPSGDPTKITVRIKRTSGANRNIGIDHPVVDIDVFGPKSKMQDVSIAARTIQAQLLSLMSAVVSNGVIQHVTCIAGPREIPEANPNFVHYNSSYELSVHS
jgi:hypothetical protein